MSPVSPSQTTSVGRGCVFDLSTNGDGLFLSVACWQDMSNKGFLHWPFSFGRFSFGVPRNVMKMNYFDEGLVEHRITEIIKQVCFIFHSSEISSTLYVLTYSLHNIEKCLFRAGCSGVCIEVCERKNKERE